MKTKILSVLLAMVLVLALFASCDGGGDSTGGGTTPGGTTPGGTTPGGTTPSEPEVVIPENAPIYNITWDDKVELRYALTENSNSNELESGCKRYYSGDESGRFETIDQLVAARNAAAEKVTNVKARYDYTAAAEGWGSNIGKIHGQVYSNDSNSPDIYCNFAYDLTCAQLNNDFANLLNKSEANYFRFNETGYNPVGEHYFDAEAGEGYFYDYMKSLSLSDDKMYVLASNYCTDLVRSFLVVPLNVQLMTSLSNDKHWNGVEDVPTFYNLVWRTETPFENNPIDLGENNVYREGWTYKVLAHYAKNVFEERNDKDSDIALADKVGFAAGTNSGLPASGFLYTTSVKIINKTSAGNGTYNYDYPDTNENLNLFATAISDLFQNSTGVITVDRDEAIAAGFASAGETDLVAIRNRFAQGNILFGGIIAVGSLEDPTYQGLRTGGDGFGILPVPLYRSTYIDADGNEQAEEYLTLVHNIARVVAISKVTKKFSACTAYLDYLSRMSQEIIDEYYDVKLSASADGGLAGEYNTHMLTYIRNHVRDCFDKTFEDAVANKMGATIEDADGKWHILLMKAKFEYGDFTGKYSSSAPGKEAALLEVLTTWNTL